MNVNVVSHCAVWIFVCFLRGTDSLCCCFFFPRWQNHISAWMRSFCLIHADVQNVVIKSYFSVGYVEMVKIICVSCTSISIECLQYIKNHQNRPNSTYALKYGTQTDQFKCNLKLVPLNKIFNMLEKFSAFWCVCVCFGVCARQIFSALWSRRLKFNKTIYLRNIEYLARNSRLLQVLKFFFLSSSVSRFGFRVWLSNIQRSNVLYTNQLIYSVNQQPVRSMEL